MTKIGTTGARAGMVPLALLAVLAAGCGTQRAGGDAGAGGPSRSAVASPSTPKDFPCPGESPTASPQPSTATPSPTAPPTDHYAENHGFMIPFELHGKRRCQGLAAVARVREALEPQRRRGRFSPESVRKALIGLGYSGGQVQAYPGDGGVGFLIQVDDYPVCVEGSLAGNPDLDGATTKADAFGGYPDHEGCDQPSGGH
ncbi:hypothetical protein ACF07Y_39915 [Streptomyces sp. NPDC016566]|uniref:hypothetical protein n=1 Tax=unclassified Streptomyces TaxID=2593676 RepID=UPI0036F161CE